MQNPRPQASEMKALLARLKAKRSPRENLRARAAAMTTEILARIQRESRLKK